MREGNVICFLWAAFAAVLRLAAPRLEDGACCGLGLSTVSSCHQLPSVAPLGPTCLDHAATQNCFFRRRPQAEELVRTIHLERGSPPPSASADVELASSVRRLWHPQPRHVPRRELLAHSARHGGLLLLRLQPSVSFVGRASRQPDVRPVAALPGARDASHISPVSFVGPSWTWHVLSRRPPGCPAGGSRRALSCLRGTSALASSTSAGGSTSAMRGASPAMCHAPPCHTIGLTVGFALCFRGGVQIASRARMAGPYLAEGTPFNCCLWACSTLCFLQSCAFPRAGRRSGWPPPWLPLRLHSGPKAAARPCFHTTCLHRGARAVLCQALPSRRASTGSPSI